MDRFFYSIYSVCYFSLDGAIEAIKKITDSAALVLKDLEE